jgi:hypothetical protein
MAEPTMDAPVAAPTDELPAIEDLPSDDMSTDGEEAPSKRSDYMAEVQKYSGKLG